MDRSPKDDLFARAGEGVKFEFNTAVARVFDDMLARSVPHYEECRQMVLQLAAPFCRAGANVYDLGCSTGSLLRLLAENLPQSVRLTGLDNSAAMLQKAREKLEAEGTSNRCRLIEADLESDFPLDNADAVIMNYTMQFIPPPGRAALVGKIFRALNPGGCFILIEKVRSESPGLDRVFVDLHHRFKRGQGYSQNEIAQKREALENVLIPFTEEQNKALLRAAGFTAVDTFFRWFNFSGLIAVRQRLEKDAPAPN
ncbi:MAG: carboxy-S-adenosyl-L-methionine synthase CmoA [Nitrospinales bacterium]